MQVPNINKQKHSRHRSCLLLLSERFKQFCLIFVSRPVVLGLRHTVSKSNTLLPVCFEISSAVSVKLGVVKEFSSLGYILCVVRLLLGLLFRANLLVLSSG